MIPKYFPLCYHQNLSAWRASLLSMVGGLILNKTIIHRMLHHCLLVYSWPSSLLKHIERWSGDINKRKLVTVWWNTWCKPTSKGGLGIRSLRILNEASNLKQCGEATLLRSRVLRNGRHISYHMFSSLWSGIRSAYNDHVENS